MRWAAPAAIGGTPSRRLRGCSNPPRRLGVTIRTVGAILRRSLTIDIRGNTRRLKDKLEAGLACSKGMEPVT